MFKRICIEGLDNCFKSTQVKLLNEFFKESKVIHFTAPKDKRTETQFKNFTDILYEINKDNRIYLCDRDIYGEYVYGPMYRKNDPNYIFTLEKVFNKLTQDSVLFLFEDSVSNVLKREDGLSFTKNYWKKLYEKIRFRIVFYKSRIPNKRIINVKGKTKEDIFNELIEFLANIN